MNTMNMNASQDSAVAVPVCRGSAYGSSTEMDDREGDDWLGCESLHPLTWLPAIPVPQQNAVA